MSDAFLGLITPKGTVEEQIQGLRLLVSSLHRTVVNMLQAVDEDRLKLIYDKQFEKHMATFNTTHDHAVLALRAIIDAAPEMQVKLNETVHG